MRLVTLRVKDPQTNALKKDGQLAVVSDDGITAALVPAPFSTLLAAIEQWSAAQIILQKIDHGIKAKTIDVVTLADFEIAAPLPRTWGWVDGSAFIQHILLVRKARGAEPPEDLYTIPLMYQGISDTLLGPNDDIPAFDEESGIDFEGELCVAVTDVPMGTKAADAHKYIALVMLMNDVSLRNLIPREVATGFGFFHGKPSSAFGPFAVTVDELGESWHEGRIHLPVSVRHNGAWFGNPNAGEMHFSFFDLIEHAAKTRSLSAGTIIGSGTVSNKDESVGSTCLAEKRMLEKIKTGSITTPFMSRGDTIEIEVIKNSRSLFGAIKQKVASN